jgi:hypothetical protein
MSPRTPLSAREQLAAPSNLAAERRYAQGSALRMFLFFTPCHNQKLGCPTCQLQIYLIPPFECVLNPLDQVMYCVKLEDYYQHVF